MAELEEGRVIGSSYRVVRCIGQGGMGTVYEVEHIELGVHYALKTFTFDPANDASHALKTKFLEEGKVLARLKHPNIAHVFDLAFDEETQMPYFVMDLVTYEDGESYTAEDVDPNDIDEEVVYGWFKELASALDYIHEQGIVHRDIKPGNLLMDKDAHVILTDFGISRIFGERLKTDLDATKTMVSKTGRGKLVLGTEKYIAPEVERGEEAVPESDAYSLGVMVLRWLTGFFYKDNPGALGLLGNKKYHWLPVIARLIAPTPDRRPKTYTDLVKQLKPLAVASRTPHEKRKKKRNKTRENIIAAVAGLFIVAILATGGYFAWQYVEKKGAERDRQVAELKKQMAADKAAAEKKEAEEKAEAERKAAEEKRIAAEKEAARKAKITERERLEATRTKIEKQDPSTLAVRETPKPAEVKPEPEKPKEEFIVVKDETSEEDTKDYGPIPNKKYKWIKANNKRLPVPELFELSNGAKIDLIPFAPASFYMSNDWTDGQKAHRVTFTWPFWISKTFVTAEQWRDFDQDACLDVLNLEKAIGSNAYVTKIFPRLAVLKFCKFLSNKYKSQIPKGYVFRLPTEAEWEFAFDREATKFKVEKITSRWWGEDVRISGKRVETEINKLIKQFNLNRFGEWYRWGFMKDKPVFVGGLTMPNAHGIIDILPENTMFADEIEVNTRISYHDEETDPLRCVASGVHCCCLVRNWESRRAYWGLDAQQPTHIVLGPDLANESSWQKLNTPQDRRLVQLPQNKISWGLDKVPTKISKPKEIKFRLANGEEMIFCTGTKGKFKMSNVPGQEKQFHKVELTKPFWIGKYFVTVKQWREFGRYDYEGICRDIEKTFSKEKYPICARSNWYQWQAYCKFLNERYGHQLPPGYVFRLPTEAELEWSKIANSCHTVDEVDAKAYDRWSGRIADDFAAMLKKKKVPVIFGIGRGGYSDAGQCIVAGRTPQNPWGLTDIFDEVPTIETCDEDCRKNGVENWHEGYPENVLLYEEEEIDPIRIAGPFANKFVARWGNRGRHMRPFDMTLPARIVIGPELQQKELKKLYGPYPTQDFCGELINQHLKFDKQSSVAVMAWNTEDCHKSLLSIDPVIGQIFDKDEKCFGFHTAVEKSPWAQFVFDTPMAITGIRIENLRYKGHTEHIRVWASNNGKQWREIAKEDLKLCRYRFDLRKKSIVAKYIRVGRDPDARLDSFSLNKLLIYGKAK